ncbi:MAG TPA: serine hydrolase [Albitalea sp.]|nr:serine hydrolase [Albitalea sp.]
MQGLALVFSALRRHARATTAAALGLLVSILALVGCATDQPARAIRVATASTSHTLCSGLFISGRDPERTYREEMRPEHGMGLIDWGLRYRVDRARREVTTTFVDRFEARAVYREGLGCVVVHGELADESAPADALPPPAPGTLADIAGDAPVLAADERIRAAIDDAFAEPDATAWRDTKAVVVVHRGRIVGERYAPGVGIDTPLHGHSVSKSVANALVGVLVREGKLSATQPAPVPEWRAGGDPRRGVTIDDLLRMTSGLPWDEYSGGFDPASRMWHVERDMAAFAAQGELAAPPRTRWAYSNRGFILVGRAVRDAVGGHAPDVARFARRELFGPLGMRHAVIEFDATGTPLLSSHVYASARDWARFGLLYLHDGVVDGRRVLPAGWVQATRTPSPGTGYGAAFWLNNTDTANPLGGHWGLPGVPADAFFARGYLGQFVVVVPSRELVVVRLGVTHRPGGDVGSVARLVRQVIDALSPHAAAS